MLTLELFVVTFVKEVLNCHWRILYALNIETLRTSLTLAPHLLFTMFNTKLNVVEQLKLS